MLAAFQHILTQALGRLGAILTAWLPPLLAALAIFLASIALALLARWILARAIRSCRLDRFLAQSGLSSLLSRSGRLRAARLVASAAYWLLLVGGGLTALSVFDTALTSRLVNGTVLLLPRLAGAAALLVAGIWLGQYFSRGALVWACNEDLPHPRWLAGAVRMVIVFVAVVVAADYLGFARTVFVSAFVILFGGAVLAAAIAGGLALHDYLRRPARPAQAERSLWNHL